MGWIIQDIQAFSVVEKRSFKSMINLFDSRYEVPSRNIIRSRIIERYEIMKPNMCQILLSNSSKFVLTTDGW